MITRADIRTLARIHSDQDSSDFPTDAQYNILIDAAARIVWVDLMNSGWPVDFSTTSFTSTGVTTYNPAALNFDVIAIHGVYAQIGGDRFELKRINEGARAQLLSTTSSVAGMSEYYDVRLHLTLGLTIELLPKSSGITYFVDYVPGFTTFSGDSANWPGPIGSGDLVALRAAIIAMSKEGAARNSEVRLKEQMYQEILLKMKDMVSWLNMRNPAMIRDVSTTHTRYAFDYPVAGFDLYA